MAIVLGPLQVALTTLTKKEEETLGLVLGRNSEATALVAVRNIARNPRMEFLGDPRAIVVAHKVAENMGLDVISIYHTHPNGKPFPSNRDVEGMRLWPFIWVIASPEGVRAWLLQEGGLREVPVI
jgi:proteasome lid subunit RPN8/RPN11